jgi:hypothetical protein
MPGRGCNRPAHLNDNEHSTGWANDGATGVSTPVGFCRTENTIKDEPRWRHDLADDGTLTISTPAGERYLSQPPPLHEPRIVNSELPPF